MENDGKPRKALARKLAQKLLKQSQITTPPVILNNVVNALKTEYDLSVHPWTFGDKIDGFQIRDGNYYAIAYNNDRHVHRKRFTVGHEIGHILFGHMHDSSGREKWKESECDTFSAELLMPYDNLINENLRTLGCKKLAMKYMVSEESMWYRLMECKLVK